MFKKRMFIFILSIFFIYSNCTSILFYMYPDNGKKFEIKETEDKFDKSLTIEMDNNFLKRDQDKIFHSLEFNFAVKKTEDITVYYIKMRYDAMDWLLLRDDETAILLLDDDETISLSYDTYTNDVYSVHHSFVDTTDVYIYESCKFLSSLEQFKKISSANLIQIKLIGTEYYTTFTFSEDNIQRLRTFILDYLDKH